MPYRLVSHLLEFPCGTARKMDDENKTALTCNYCSSNIFYAGTHTLPPAPLYALASVALEILWVGRDAAAQERVVWGGNKLPAAVSSVP